MDGWMNEWMNEWTNGKHGLSESRVHRTESVSGMGRSCKKLSLFVSISSSTAAITVITHSTSPSHHETPTRLKCCPSHWRLVKGTDINEANRHKVNARVKRPWTCPIFSDSANPATSVITEFVNEISNRPLSGAVGVVLNSNSRRVSSENSATAKQPSGRTVTRESHNTPANESSQQVDSINLKQVRLDVASQKLRRYSIHTFVHICT